MISHVCALPFKHSGLTIFFFGDRQQGSPGYHKEAWQEFKREFQASQPAYALGLGDYGDWLRPSLRPALTSALAKDDSARQMLDDQIRRSHDQIIDDMEFLKGRLIGLHQGHHCWEFASGGNTDQRLASALKAPYLGWTALTRLVLQIGDQKKAGRSKVHTIVSTHGNANGRKVHTSLGWLEGNYAASWIADTYVMGHGCKNANEVPFQRNVARRVGPPGWDTQIPRVMAVGGFCKAYTDGFHSDYVERAGMTPQPPGYGVMRLKLTESMAALEMHGVLNEGRKRNSVLQVELVNRVLNV